MRKGWRESGWDWIARIALGVIGLALAFSSAPTLRAQAAVNGEWKTLGRLMPINPVHAALMHNGKILIVSGSGNVAAETNFRYAVLDLQADTLDVTNNQPWDMFCNGMVVLSDGRVLVNGGNLKYDPFWGQPKNAVFDPATGVFTDIQNMAHGRWYPTVTTLGDGRVMTFSGLNESGGTNTAVEIYTLGTGWSPQYTAGWTPPLYPRMHLLPDGRVIYTGSGTGSRIFDPTSTTPSWSGIVATTNYTGTRTYGTSVLLPLRASEGYKASVMIFGGGNPATKTTEILDTSVLPLKWQYGPSMSQARIEMNATILPNGKVLATGGSVNDEDASTKSLNADLYDPVTKTFSSAGSNAYARLYHSNSLLLPDATVLLMGGNPTRGTYEQHMEIYSPAYLFDSSGNPALRPTFTLSSTSLSYGGAFDITTPNPSDIASVVLVRPGAPTHAFDMEQRLVELPISTAGGTLTATAPPDGNVAPPGYYMLFILNAAGVPSVATFVHLPAPATNQAPTASIDSPVGNVTVNPGGAVSYSGSGSDSDGSIASYAWTFAGGAPAASSAAAPGNVTYSTPGTYQTSLKVTDNGGLTSAAATRTITVSDFSIAASPSSATVAQGANAGYTVTVGALSGFTGTVALSATGLPTGATATFSPASIAGSGSSALTVATSGTTPGGSYAITISGASGPVSHSVNATLVVNGPANQAPTAKIDSPAGNVTVNPGGAVSYSGSGTDPDGTIASYAWTFAGGSPGSSAAAAPGNVTYSTPGSYQTSLKVTDNGGLASGAATRTITVSDFSLTATPSASVVQGGSASYAATVGALSGFTGTVALSVTGVPAGASATFTPPSITGSGSSALNVTAGATTATGVYTLTIRGASGPVSHTVTAKLTVLPVGDFTITASPTSRTILRGMSTTYTIAIVPSDGFNSAVALSVGPLPKQVTARFDPTTITPSSSSTLTLTTKLLATKAGTSTITITGANGPLTHAVSVTLTVR